MRRHGHCADIPRRSAQNPDGERPPRAAARLRIIINANASGTAKAGGADDLEALFRAAGADVVVSRTATLDELARVWSEDDGARLVLVGGDGSVHAAVNLPGPARDVALIPAGRVAWVRIPAIYEGSELLPARP